MQIYENASGFSLEYPGNRTYQEGVYGSLVMFFSPWSGTGDKFKENLGVVSELLPSDMTVDEYYALAKPQLQQIVKDYTELLNENITIDGLTAKKIIYRGTQGTYKLQREQVFFIKNKVAYVLTYTASADTFNDRNTEAEKIIVSFKVK
jgi:hypothetical protein